MISELQNNKDFQALSPEARSIVFEKMSANDADFAKLSPEAKGIVKSKIVGTSQTEIPGPVAGMKPAAPEEKPSLGAASLDAFKRGVAGTLAFPSLMGDALVSPLRVVQHGLSKITDSVPAPDYAGFHNAVLPAYKEDLGVKDIPVPTNEYGKPSKANEYIVKGAEFLGAGMVPGIGVVSAAERKLAAALVELFGTGASATSAVEGKEFGKNMAPKLGVSPERGEMIGEFVGSLAGPVAIAKGADIAQRGTAAAADKFSDATGITGVTKEAQARAGKAMAIEEIKKSLEAAPQSTKNLQEAVAAQEAIPGFKPTLGQATNAPGVIAIEKKVAHENPVSLAKATERQAENEAAISRFSDQSFPASVVSPTKPAESRFSNMVKNQQAKLDSVNQQISRLSDRVESGATDTAAIGERLRELRGEAQRVAKGVKDAAYRDVYDSAEKAGLKADVSDVRDLIKEVAESDAQAAQIMPRAYSDISAAIKKQQPTKQPIILGPNGEALTKPQGKIEVSFEALHSMQKRANEDLFAAVASGDNAAAYRIGKVRDALTDKLKAFEGPEYGDVAQKLQSANSKNAEYSRIFKEGLGGRTGPSARNKFGEITNDEDVVRKLIFNPENKRGLSEFFDIYGSNPEAQQLLRNGVMDMFSKAVVRDGEISPNLVESFVRKHKQQLDMVPQLKAELQGIDTVNDALLARREAIAAQRKAMDKSLISKISSESVSDALTNPDVMKILVNQAKKNPEAAKSLSRAIADEVSSQKNPYQFITENEATLKPQLEKLGENHFQNLKSIAKAEEISNRVKPPDAVELSKLQDVGERTVGTSVKGILSRLMNAEKGYMSKEYIIADLGGRYIYKTKMEEAKKIMESAIYDPEIAKALLQMNREPNKQHMNNLMNHLYSHGIRVESVAAENQK